MYGLLLISIILFAVYVGVHTVKQKIMFMPSDDISIYPDDIDDVYIDNIHAWYSTSTKTNKTVLYCHGNSGNIGGRANIVRRWNEFGYSILMFDYPSYGLSTGQATEKSVKESAVKCLEYLLKHVKKENIILYGESIGCSVAAYLAAEYNMPCLIFQSGFSSLKDLVVDYVPSFLSWISEICTEFDTYSYLKKFNGKLLLLHSQEDEIIPYSHAQKMNIYATKLITIEGSHNFPKINMDDLIGFIHG